MELELPILFRTHSFSSTHSLNTEFNEKPSGQMHLVTRVIYIQNKIEMQKEVIKLVGVRYNYVFNYLYDPGLFLHNALFPHLCCFLTDWPLHSFLSTQKVPLLSRVYPLGQTHLNPPMVFLHIPGGGQRPCNHFSKNFHWCYRKLFYHYFGIVCILSLCLTYMLFNTFVNIKTTMSELAKPSRTNTFVTSRNIDAFILTIIGF